MKLYHIEEDVGLHFSQGRQAGEVEVMDILAKEVNSIKMDPLSSS